MPLPMLAQVQANPALLPFLAVGIPVAVAAGAAAFTRALVRRWPTRANLATGVFVGGVPALYLLILGVSAQVVLGVWDALVVCAAVAVGAAIARQIADKAVRRKRAILVVGSTLVWLLVVEIAMAAWGVQVVGRSDMGPQVDEVVPQRMSDDAQVRFGTMGRGWDQHSCGLLFDADPWKLRIDEALGLAVDEAAVVVHFGDSMTYGLGISPTRRFTTLLSARQNAAHINAAVPAMAPDFHLAMAERHLAKLRPKTAVLHLFSDNDVHELGAPMGCCHGRPLYDFGEDPPRLNCHERSDFPVATNFLTWLGRHSPPPLPVRALSPYSRLAATTERVFGQLGRVFEPEGEIDPRQAGALIVKISRRFIELAEKAGAKPVVVLHPTRRELENQQPPYSHGLDETIAKQLENSGAKVVDLWAPLRRHLEVRGPRIFLDHEPEDPHYNAAGHRLVARILAAYL